MSAGHVSSPVEPASGGAPRTRETAARAAADLVGIALVAPLGPLGSEEPDSAVRAVQALLRRALHS